MRLPVGGNTAPAMQCAANCGFQRGLREVGAGRTAHATGDHLHFQLNRSYDRHGHEMRNDLPAPNRSPSSSTGPGIWFDSHRMHPTEF